MIKLQFYFCCIGLTLKLKADRPHLRNYPHVPTDYRHTDKHLRLVIWLCFADRCTRQSGAPNIDSCVPVIWPWPLTLTFDLDPDLWPWPHPLTFTLEQCENSDVKTWFLAFDLDLWPTTLIYNPNLYKVKVNIHTKYQGCKSSGSAVRGWTDGQTDEQMLPSTLSPSLLWILVYSDNVPFIHLIFTIHFLCHIPVMFQSKHKKNSRLVLYTSVSLFSPKKW